MKGISEILYVNFWKFDFLIFILFIANFYFIYKTLKLTGKINDKLNPRAYTAGGWQNYEDMKNYYNEVMSLDGEENLINLRRNMNFNYSFFENITSIFPLMGLLGTVLSLIPMVNSIGKIETGLFFSALTSTLWGIIFAIISKLINGYLESQISESESGIQNLLDRYSTMVRGKYEKKESDN